MYRSQILNILFLAITVSMTSSLQAETIWVDTVLDSAGCPCTFGSSCCSLRNAIAVASPSDTVTFKGLSGSTIELNGGELFIDKNLIIDGDLDNDLSPDITITTSTESRIIKIDNALLVTLDGLTIFGGKPAPALYGAGISIGTGGITSKGC